jgi:hypothetical protein
MHRLVMLLKRWLLNRCSSCGKRIGMTDDCIECEKHNQIIRGY